MNFTLEHQTNGSAIGPHVFVKMLAGSNGLAFHVDTFWCWGGSLALWNRLENGQSLFPCPLFADCLQ